MFTDEGEVTRKVAPVEENVGKGHTEKIRHCPSDEYMRASARAARKVRNARVTATKAYYVDAPTDAAEAVRVFDVISKSRSIAKDRRGVVRDTEAPVFLRTRSS